MTSNQRHDRGARQAVTADIGNVGRRTGAAMPREGDVRLTQDGYEDIDDFFKSPPPSFRPTANANAHARAASSKKSASKRHATAAAAAPAPLEAPGSASRRQRAGYRPDVTHEIGVRGRKTGVAIAPTSTDGNIRRDSNGMEDMDLYFSQGPASVPPIRKSSGKKRQQPLATVEDSAQEDEDEDDDDRDAQASVSNEEESDVENQTANYGARGQTSRVKARRSEASTVDESGSDMEQDEDQGEDDGDDNDEQVDEGSTPETQVGRRHSQASRADTTYGIGGYYNGSEGEVDDGGTQTMDIEGSSYYNKSNKSFAAQLGNKSSRVDDRTTDFDKVPSSPSTTTLSKHAASTSKRGAMLRDLNESSDDDEDEEGIQASLTRSASKHSRSAQRNRDSPPNETSASIKGKERARDEPSDDEDGDDDFDDAGAGGYEPADQDGYPDQSGYEDEEPQQDDRSADEQEDEDDDGVQDDGDGPLEPLAEEDKDAGSQEEDAAISQTAAGSKKRKRAGPHADDSGNANASGSEQSARGKQPAARKRKKTVEHPDGVRRSQRDRTSPLEFWRNEHVVYRRRDSGLATYYEKVDVYTRPKPPVRHLGVQGRKGSAAAQKRARSASQAAANGKGKTRSISVGPAGDAHAGDGVNGPGALAGDGYWAEWDEETEPDGIVWDYVDGAEVKKRVAFTKAMLDPKPTKNHAYKFQRIFTDGDFMAGGVLVIPPGEAKPLKPARDNTYMLYCVQGAVRVLVHRTEFTISQGGFFMIPRGNSYQINNLTEVEAFLVFMQARELTAVMEGDGNGN